MLVKSFMSVCTDSMLEKFTILLMLTKLWMSGFAITNFALENCADLNEVSFSTLISKLTISRVIKLTFRHCCVLDIFNHHHMQE